jgi:uncharacterized protein YhfF
MRTAEADRYWTQYVESLPLGMDQPERYADTFSFGTAKQEATEIAALVLQGVKTATGSLQWVYEAEGQPLPKVGDQYIVRDSEDRPVCIIEVTEVQTMPFDEVDGRFAFHGGERDRTLASWRKIYRAYIASECARIGREPSEKTPLVCERFRVVYREPLRHGERSSVVD